MGHRTDMYAVDRRKILPYRDSNSDSSAVQSVANRYTDWAIPAPGKRVTTFFLITGIPNIVRRPVFPTEHNISGNYNFPSTGEKLGRHLRSWIR
jgi:hypothetical protein